MGHRLTNAKERFLSAGLLACCILLVSGTIARSIQVQAAPEKRESAAAQAPVPSPKPASLRARPFASAGLNPKAKRFYQLTWGVEIVGVKLVSSGLMVRFSYRVLDAEKGKVLNDKKATPLLFDHNSGAQLVVPTMEKVGQLRQSSSPEIGREYWMVFSNKGGFVKAGSRVDVVIGNFRAQELIVQ